MTIPRNAKLFSAGLQRALVFADAVSTAVGNGDAARVIGERTYQAEQIACELDDVLAKRILGRTSADRITIATLTELGAQDLAAAQMVT